MMNEWNGSTENNNDTTHNQTCYMQSDE